jgi:hypothetical protein
MNNAKYTLHAIPFYYVLLCSFGLLIESKQAECAYIEDIGVFLLPAFKIFFKALYIR